MISRDTLNLHLLLKFQLYIYIKLLEKHHIHLQRNIVIHITYVYLYIIDCEKYDQDIIILL